MSWLSSYIDSVRSNSAAAVNQANIELSQEQMNFQERMRNTAHQAEVADLRAAGLNPILSATGGNGAAVPSGSLPTLHAANYDFYDPKSTAKQNQLLDEQIKAARRSSAAETISSLASANLATAQAEKVRAEIPFVGETNVMNLPSRGLNKGGDLLGRLISTRGFSHLLSQLGRVSLDSFSNDREWNEVPVRDRGSYDLDRFEYKTIYDKRAEKVRFYRRYKLRRIK